MESLSFGNWQVEISQLSGLIHRLQIQHDLLRRFLEEQVIDLVDSLDKISDEQINLFRKANGLEDDTALESFLSKRCWSIRDLKLEACRGEALHRFANDRFGSGIEDIFLSRKSDLDKITYSIIRVRDLGLARELSIQINEGEISFSKAAREFGVGPES